MPEPTFRDLCDRLKVTCPALTHSKVKREVAAFVSRTHGSRSLDEMTQLGYYLMHPDPVGEEATNKAMTAATRRRV